MELCNEDHEWYECGLECTIVYDKVSVDYTDTTNSEMVESGLNDEWLWVIIALVEFSCNRVPCLFFLAELIFNKESNCIQECHALDFPISVSLSRPNS